MNMNELDMDRIPRHIAIIMDGNGRWAAEQGKPLHHHFAHLVIHGTLHLMGFDHIEDEDADRMETLEIELLRQLNIPNPY